MFFSYTVSVILLSLSMYGIWCFFQDLWKWWLERPLESMPTCSFLVVIRTLDGQTEELLRFFADEMERKNIDWDIVVVVASYNDLPVTFLEGLLSDTDKIQVMINPNGHQAVSEALGLCRGKVVHILDLCNRLSIDEFMVTVCALLRQESHEVVVRRMME